MAAKHINVYNLTRQGSHISQLLALVLTMCLVLQVPQNRRPKQGARGPNDENIPPGQHAFAAQTPAAVKKGRGLAEEATPALRVSSRQRQKVLR